MVHGDDAGLKLPPRVAPVQVIIVPIWRTESERQAVETAVDRARERLAEVARVRVDARDGRTPGFKFNEWELKGVPLRLEIGPRDVTADRVVLVRRDTREKRAVPMTDLGEAVRNLLDDIQTNLFTMAQRTLAERTVVVESERALAERVAANAGWSLAAWCGDAACEARVKAETTASSRTINQTDADRAWPAAATKGGSWFFSPGPIDSCTVPMSPNHPIAVHNGV